MITIRNRWTQDPIRAIDLENLRGANLGDADLRSANLGDADLRNANLRGANLRNANLGDANLRNANLRGANLGDADLGDADLGGANLGDADLGDADLGDADLGGADLGGANLRDADLGGANLRGANLRDARMNWQSHDLLSEILRQHANSVEREMVAGFILISRHRCWRNFLELKDHPQFEWAIGVLREYVQENDGHPTILDRTP